jgi:hypothetical protein
VEGVDYIAESEPDCGVFELIGRRFTTVKAPTFVKKLATARGALLVVRLQVVCNTGCKRKRKIVQPDEFVSVLVSELEERFA